MGGGNSSFAKEYPIGAKVPWYLFLFKNRWSRLVIYALSGLFTSLFFDGWQDISDMMFREGVYSWRCPQPWNGEICESQYQAVQRLFTVSIISCGSNSLTGGFLVDLIGPMMTALVAEMSFMLGLALWAISSQSIQLYIPAFIFLAAGVNPLSFAVLEIRQMFPGREALIVSIVMAPLTVAPIVPLVLNRIHVKHASISMSSLITAYLLIFALPTAIMIVLSLPVWRFPSAVPFIGDGVSTADLVPDPADMDLGSEEGDDAAPASSAKVSLPKSFCGIEAVEEGDRFHPLAGDADRPAEATPIAETNPSEVEAFDIKQSMSELRGSAGRTSFVDGSRIPTRTAGSEKVDEKEQHLTDRHGGRHMKAHKVDWMLLSYEMRTPEFWLYTVFNVISCLQIGYYPTTVRAWGTTEQGETLSRFYGIVTPTQVVYSISFGAAVAFTSSVGMAMIFCFFLMFLFAFASIPSFGLQYATCMLSNFVQSFIFTLRYTFAGEKFCNQNFGLLVGILGTFPALSYPISFGVQLPSVFLTLYIILLCITAISFSCVVALLVRQCKKYDMKEWTSAAAAAARQRRALGPFLTTSGAQAAEESRPNNEVPQADVRQTIEPALA